MIRITKKRKSLISKLSLYIGEQNAKKDLYELFESGCSLRFINSLIDCQKERWDLESVKFCFQKHKDKRWSELSYDPVFISKRYNCNHEEALIKIKEYKSNKATSKENFFKKHGKEIGAEKFKRFQETSRSSIENLKNNLIKEYGEEEGLEKFSKEMASRSKFSPEFYIKRFGVSYEEAYRRAREENINNAGVSRKYYENLGYSDDEIDVVFIKIREKQKRHGRNRKFLKEKYGENWIYVYKKNAEEYRKKMEEVGAWIPLNELREFDKYKKLCWFWTKQTLEDEKIKDIERRSREYQLDHMFSLKMGFINDVDPRIIGSKYNLEIISGIENARKSNKCSISLETLLNLFYENQ